MRRVVPVLALVACGGKPPPPPPPPPVVHEAPKPQRVVVETDKDDEPQDGIKFKNTRGKMDQEAIKAGLEPHAQELSDCYMTKVGRRRWLGGHVVLHWDIKRDGTVTSVKLSESDLGNWDIEQCLLEAARTATFDKPQGGDADFTVPLDFSAKGNAQIWDEDKSLRAIGGQLAKLDTCPDPKLKLPKAKDGDKPPHKAPKPVNVTITLYVGPHGKAESVGFSSPTAEIGDDWALCAEKAAEAWRLPDPRGQIAKLAIRYKPRQTEEAER
ncbi:MAG: TonB family protein [Deltaproteobacteria bacterium]|nr:TonB family protein [Deltaproteobacteria bacterium]